LRLATEQLQNQEKVQNQEKLQNREKPGLPEKGLLVSEEFEGQVRFIDSETPQTTLTLSPLTSVGRLLSSQFAGRFKANPVSAGRRGALPANRFHIPKPIEITPYIKLGMRSRNALQPASTM